MTGCRTPFARSGSVSRDVMAVDLAAVALCETIERSDLDPASIDAVVTGRAVRSVKDPSLARAVILRALRLADPASTAAGAREAVR